MVGLQRILLVWPVQKKSKEFYDIKTITVLFIIYTVSGKNQFVGKSWLQQGQENGANLVQMRSALHTFFKLCQESDCKI